MKLYIHDYDRNLEREIENLKRFGLSEHNKELILEFYRYNYSRDISKPRMMRQINSLKYGARFVKKDFEKATAKDFQEYIAFRKEQGRATATIDTDKEIFKTFYKWLDNGKYFEVVEWMRSRKKKSNKLPENLLTQEDIKEMEKKANNPRDKAFLTVLWETGARVGELGTLQLKNVVFDEMGCKILVNGKTGMRRIRIINSAPSLLEWINQHPNRSNPEAFVWVNRIKRFGILMTHRSIMRMLKLLGLRAGIKKPVNPHHFRHSRATYMSQFLTEAQMKEYFGWCQNSDMVAQYVHLSGKQVDDAILRMHGLKEPDKKEDILKNRSCPRCKTLNDHNNKYCEKCWLPLTEQAANELDEIQEQDQNGIISLMKLMELVENNPVKVRQALTLLKQEAKGGF